MLNAALVLEASAAIRSMLKSTPEQSQAWAEAVAQACGWMQPYQFHEVCKAFLPEMTAGRSPAPKQLIAVFYKLKQERGWDRTEQKCDSCNGMKFVYTRLQHRENEEVITAMRPCPTCRRTVETKPDWIELPISEPKSMREKWDALSEPAKHAALDYAEGLSKLIRKPEYLEKFMAKTLPGKP